MIKLSELEGHERITVRDNEESDFNIYKVDEFIAEFQTMSDVARVRLHVTLAGEFIPQFSFDSVFEQDGDECYEDWDEDVMNDCEKQGLDLKEIEKTINRVYSLNPAYYEGKEIDIFN